MQTITPFTDVMCVSCSIRKTVKIWGGARSWLQIPGVRAVY